MKKIISCALIALATIPTTLYAQWDANKAYYIQTKAGLCLSDQGTKDPFALVRFADPKAQDPNQQWQIKPQGDAFILTNKASGLAIDNTGTPVLNLFQMPLHTDTISQQWRITPVKNKKGYYIITPVAYTDRSWSTNFNLAVSLVKTNPYTTQQWYRISETVQEADTVTMPDEAPIITTGVQELTFSTAEAPVWYLLNPFYASSPNVNKRNLLAYYDKDTKRYLAKGAANTKLEVETFDNPDAALWRIEGDSTKAFLVNKATNLRMTLPTNIAPGQRFTLTPQGSPLAIKKAQGLSNNMMPDAYYIDPIDATASNKGRLNVDGLSSEIILYKNGTADVIGGKGSVFIFIDTPTRKVSATSSDPKLGKVEIAASMMPTGEEAGNFVFSIPEQSEAMTSVTRALRNAVSLRAVPTASAMFVAWKDAKADTVMSKENPFSYTGSANVKVLAVFKEEGLTAIGSAQNAALYQVNAERSLLTTASEVVSVSLTDVQGRMYYNTTAHQLDLQTLPTGQVYVLTLHTATDCFQTKIIR